MKTIRRLLIAVVSIATLSLAAAGPDEDKDDLTAAEGGTSSSSTNDPSQAEPALKLAELSQCSTQPKIACRAPECQGYCRLIHECTNVDHVQLDQEDEADIDNDDNTSTILYSSQGNQSQPQPQPQQRAAAALVILAGCPSTRRGVPTSTARPCRGPASAATGPNWRVAPAPRRRRLTSCCGTRRAPRIPIGISTWAKGRISSWTQQGWCSTKSPSPRATMSYVLLPALPSLWLASYNGSRSISSSSATTTIVNAFSAMYALGRRAFDQVDIITKEQQSQHRAERHLQNVRGVESLCPELDRCTGQELGKGNM